MKMVLTSRKLADFIPKSSPRWLAISRATLGATALCLSGVCAAQATPTQNDKTIFSCETARGALTVRIEALGSKPTLVLSYPGKSRNSHPKVLSGKATFILLPGNQSGETRLVFPDGDKKIVVYKEDAKAELVNRASGIVTLTSASVQNIQGCVSYPNVDLLFYRLNTIPGLVSYVPANFASAQDPVSLPDDVWTSCESLSPSRRAKLCRN